MKHYSISRRTLLSLLPAGLVYGQSPSFSTDVKVVSLLATVRNKKGEIVRTLEKDDFQLTEDGRPQTIRYFSRETDLPLTVGLLVDTSLSQERVLAQERAAAARFCKQVLREDKDQAFVIHFDFEVELLQDLTQSHQRLASALAKLEVPQEGALMRRDPNAPPRRRRGGGTTLYDSVLLASEEMMARQSGRKALIILSDGVDTGSRTRLENAIEAAQRADSLVYTILFADDDFQRGPMIFGGGRRPQNPPFERRSDGKRVLDQIARETGAVYYEVSRKQPIDKVFASIEEELRNQYSIGYSSDQSGSGFRKIALTTRQKEYLVRTRDGYYAR
jgi:VWFA-related protein